MTPARFGNGRESSLEALTEIEVQEHAQGGHRTGEHNRSQPPRG